ncbi:peptidoglycan-binding domain-containing protein [Ralstonia pseudosolanacearum]|uniref:peptidoglycan-binding domain-containing protein n=1 Tax=Ralstonia pseudosolanacearum TaxID=1310165 RepID=UPI001FFB8345|nr:peptidoglycan-binding domain-containing protein [Ralstonia pseudosolanacearum]
MIKSFAKGVLSLVAASAMSACAPMISGAMNAAVTEDSLKAKTADYLGVPAESVVISSMDKGALSTTYKAQYGDNRYGCTIYYGQLDCKQLPSVAAPNRNSSAMVAQPDQTPGMSYAQAQTRLNELGFSVGTPDGVLGKKSVQQLKLFQRSRGLQETGRLDTSTIQALR